jgi:hypothetical protein
MDDIHCGKKLTKSKANIRHVKLLGPAHAVEENADPTCRSQSIPTQFVFWIETIQIGVALTVAPPAISMRQCREEPCLSAEKKLEDSPRPLLSFTIAQEQGEGLSRGNAANRHSPAGIAYELHA